MNTPVQSFPPIVSASARVLILGSMPGVRSLEAQQYYAHPRNLFWPFMHALLGVDPSTPYLRRIRALEGAGVAVWDVLASCERKGSLDSAIRDDSAAPNDLGTLLTGHPSIGTILFNGAKADQTFRRFAGPGIRDGALRCLRMPSTSPANASQRTADKLQRWRQGLLAAGLDVRALPASD